jgi:CTP synthase
VNNNLRPQLEKAGLVVSGLSADNQLVEMIELPSHPFFIAGQFHPEFNSTPRDGHPLFQAFVAAAYKFQKKQRE